MIRPTADPPVANASATGPAAIDDALGINVSTGTVGSASAKAGMPASANAGMLPGSNGAPAPNATVPNEPVPAAPVPSEPNGALNAVPWEARNLMNEPMTEINGPNDWTIETSWTQMTKAERVFLTKGNWRSPQWAKDNVTEALVNVYDWLCLPIGERYSDMLLPHHLKSRFPCHQLNGSFNALSALRKTVQWANQRVFEENENDTPIAFVAFRRTKATAMRRWVAGGPGGNARVKLANYFNRQRWVAGGPGGNARVKLANYFNRQFTDHISTFEGDDNGLDNWRWRMEPLSHATAGIVRVPMTDPMCLRTPRLLLTLNETMEWGMHATNAGESLLEWRLMGHTMVPLCESIGAGLEHDCSTWDEIYEDGGNDAPNAWNASKAKANDQAVGTGERV
eukprot:s6061_g2.t1